MPPLKPEQEQRIATLKRWRDPVVYIRDVFGEDLEGGPWAEKGQRAYQAEIARSIRDNEVTYVVSGNSVGKDYTISRVVCWWLRVPGSIAVTTSVKDDQLKKILWKEIRAAVQKANRRGFDIGGKLAPAASFWDFGETPEGYKHYATGVVGTDENAFQGFHSRRVLVIGDESAGIPEFVWPAMLGCGVGEGDRFAFIGNPTCSPAHPFAKGCRRPNVPGKHKTIRVKSTETPNYRQKRPVIPGLMSRQGVDRIYRSHPKGSAIANARVDAKFPDAGALSLIGYEHIGPCRERFVSGVEPSDRDRKSARVGCDVARFGDDLCTAYVRQGPLAFMPSGWPKPNVDQVEVTDALAAMAREYHPLTVSIDGGAMGPGPIDFLRNDEHRRRLQVPGHTQILEVLFGGKAADEEQFADRRTELWVLLRDWLKDEAAMEIDDDLEEELLAPEFKWVGRRMKLEPKEKTKERLGRSPDRADGLALAVSGHVGHAPSLVLTGYGREEVREGPSKRLRECDTRFDEEDRMDISKIARDHERFLERGGSGWEW